uniref:BPTI/Kunitz inhibitor domain-containing protein n=1 Tax=Stegastes partitus TaxID=144197 RepID=A0A3B5BDG8_9TELE
AAFFCKLPSDAGEGQAFIGAFFYDVTKDHCNPMLYKGSGGNANRFATEIQCIRNCSLNAVGKTRVSIEC